MNSPRNQSWDHVANWYDTLVGGQGQYYHQHVIFPGVLRLLNLQKGDAVLDLACGQGAFSRELAKNGAVVTGIDASPRLIDAASKYVSRAPAFGRKEPQGLLQLQPDISYVVDDARTLAKVQGQAFTHVVSILALQNIDPIDTLFANVSKMLEPHGSFIIVILHPSFRSPRITGWGEDEKRKLQFRRVDRYVTPMKIPIDMHPGSHKKSVTWTYHRPLHSYIEFGTTNGLMVDGIEEWVSDKTSEGRNARQENLARSEIPMFMAIRYRKI